WRARYLDVMTQVVDHPDPTARAALFTALQGGWTLAAVDTAVTLATKVVGRLDPIDPWRAAVGVLVEGARSRSARGPIVALIDDLLDAALADLAPAGERDQLPYQRLLFTVEQLTTQRQPAAAGMLKSLAVRLLAEPITWKAGVRTWLAASPNNALGPVVMALVETARSSRSHLAIEHAAAAEARYSGRQWTEVEALDVIDTLMADEAPARLVAARMIDAFGQQWAWSQAWVERLGKLRADDDLDVSVAARGVWVSLA
ncbi:MAG: hypothetical protein KDK70_32780, partial [Myxococcales bacterium]|nr:hypothetical protein [Myxococcales bacterium]